MGYTFFLSAFLPIRTVHNYEFNRTKVKFM